MIAANTNWKYDERCFGKRLTAQQRDVALALKLLGREDRPRLADEVPKEARADSPCTGVPKPILNAQRTHTTSTIAKVAKVRIMLLIDQRFCMTPP